MVDVIIKFLFSIALLAPAGMKLDLDVSQTVTARLDRQSIN